MQELLTTIFIAPLVNLLFFIYAIVPFHDFGVSIIIMTLIIRFALWPLTARQLHSQKKMQALQPEIAKIKAQTKGDKTKESQMLMELYKQKEISPFSACLPLLLQFPFLIALYFVFQIGTQDIGSVANMLYPFVENLSFIQNLLANPSSFNPTLLGVVDMTKPSIALALIAGATQYIQVKMITPKPVPGAAKDPQAQATQMMNYVFPALTIFIAWSLAAALPLYWSVTNIVSIAQQFLISRSEVEHMEEVKIVSKPEPKKLKKPKKNKKAKK